MSKTDIDEILMELAISSFGENDPTSDRLDEPLATAKAKLQSLIDTRVREARIAELNKMYGASPQSWGSAYAAIENRLAELKEGKQND